MIDRGTPSLGMLSRAHSSSTMSSSSGSEMSLKCSVKDMVLAGGMLHSEFGPHPHR